MAVTMRPDVLATRSRSALDPATASHRSGIGGFAYMWTLLVIAFMGVATLIASHAYEISVRRDQERELLFVGHEFRNAIGRYYEFGQHDYPATLEDMLQDKRVPNIQRYLRRIYRDPLTGKLDWELVRLNGKIVGVRSQSKRQPIKQGNFEPEDSAFVGKSKYAEWVFVYPTNLVLPSEVKLEDGKSADDNAKPDASSPSASAAAVSASSLPGGPLPVSPAAAK